MLLFKDIYLREIGFMKRVLNYFGVIRYINILFVLLFIFLISMVSYKIINHSKEFKIEKYKELEAFSSKLDFSLKEKVEAISYLKSSAELLLNSPSSKCPSIIDMVSQADGEDYYTIDEAYHKDLDITYRTNVTGYGNINRVGLDKNELCMALSLNPLLTTVGNLITDSAWIYYTSKEGFINLFPYVHSDAFRLQKKDMDKECFTYATPTLNPDKSLFWTPLYVDAGGLGLMTTIGAPVYHDREFKGAVTLDMTLEHLDDLMVGLGAHKGSSFIVNAQDQILSAYRIEGVLDDKINDAKTFIKKEILKVENSNQGFIELEDYFLYKKTLTNAPWDFIYFFDKNEMYKSVFLKVLPGILLFIFMIFGRALISKLTSTQNELEVLNDSLEEKVQIKVEELKNQKSTYETLFERAGSGMCILQNAKIIECNDSFVEILGVSSKKELIGHYILEFAPVYQKNGATSLKVARKVQRDLIAGGDFSHEWQTERKDGSLVWVDIVSKIIVLNDEKVVQLIFNDITERKRLEKENKEQMNQLLQQSRLAQMGEMLSMISHQWRQPLSSIAMVVMNLEVKIKTGKLSHESEEESQKSDDFVLERIERIEKYVQYLANTIDDFRNFFRPQKETKEFFINTLLDETIELINPTLESKRIIVEREYQLTEKIVSYENEIKQVILNILNNAKDVLVEKELATPLIMIRTYIEDKSSVIEIEDNGGGINEEYLSQVFDPYFSTKSKNGTGLGLYMSKTIIEEHCKGNLSVRNCESGACFTIRLPQS